MSSTLVWSLTSAALLTKIASELGPEVSSRRGNHVRGGIIFACESALIVMTPPPVFASLCEPSGGPLRKGQSLGLCNALKKGSQSRVWFG
jgi:hypothetical protein